MNSEKAKRGEKSKYGTALTRGYLLGLISGIGLTVVLLAGGLLLLAMHDSMHPYQPPGMTFIAIQTSNAEVAVQLTQTAQISAALTDIAGTAVPLASTAIVQAMTETASVPTVTPFDAIATQQAGPTQCGMFWTTEYLPYVSKQHQTQLEAAGISDVTVMVFVNTWRNGCSMNTQGTPNAKAAQYWPEFHLKGADRDAAVIKIEALMKFADGQNYGGNQIQFGFDDLSAVYAVPYSGVVEAIKAGNLRQYLFNEQPGG